MKFICETFSRIGVTFRDEFNEPSSAMIVYSVAIVTASNYPLIMRSNALLATTHATVL